MGYTCLDVTKSLRVCLDDSSGYLVEEYVDKATSDVKERRILARTIPFYAFRNYCRRCAHPLPRGWSECRAHDEELEILDATLAAGLYYTHKVKDLLDLHSNILTSYILELKQSRSKAPLLAASMALIVKTKVYGIGVSDIDVVTFVPKHESELKVDADDGERYNQAELLARYVARYLDISFVNVIDKVRPLSLRRVQSIRERYDWSSQVYVVREGKEHFIRGKRVLLVDDVRTSGATGNTIARLLKQAGAAKVYLLVAGRATHYDTLKEIIDEYGGNPEIA